MKKRDLVLTFQHIFFSFKLFQFFFILDGSGPSHVFQRVSSFRNKFVDYDSKPNKFLN